MIIGVIKEIHHGELRVAMTLSVVKQFINTGNSVLVEYDAGVIANFTDEQYQDSGATIIKSAHKVWEHAFVILKIRPPKDEIIHFRKKMKKVKLNNLLQTRKQRTCFTIQIRLLSFLDLVWQWLRHITS